MENLLRKIKNAVEEDDFNKRFILKSVLKQIICPMKEDSFENFSKDHLAKHYAVNFVVDEVFKNIEIRGPEGQEYPYLKETIEFQEAMQVLGVEGY